MNCKICKKPTPFSVCLKCQEDAIKGITAQDIIDELYKRGEIDAPTEEAARRAFLKRIGGQ